MILVAALLILVVLVVAAVCLYVMKAESEWLDSEVGETDSIDWNYDK